VRLVAKSCRKSNEVPTTRRDRTGLRSVTTWLGLSHRRHAADVIGKINAESAGAVRVTGVPDRASSSMFESDGKLARSSSPSSSSPTGTWSKVLR